MKFTCACQSMLSIPRKRRQRSRRWWSRRFALVDRCITNEKQTTHVIFVEFFQSNFISWTDLNMTGRKYLSGAAKRKIKDDKIRFEAKLPKLTNFFSTFQVPLDDQSQLETSEINQTEANEEISSITKEFESYEKIDDNTGKPFIYNNSEKLND